MLDSSRENLARACFHYLGIDSNYWGDAISQRPLRLVGEATPWDISIATVSDFDVLRNCFGPDLKHTVACELEVECLTDIKHEDYDKVRMEVEIGVPLDYQHFRMVGGKGKILVADSNRNGHVVSVVMTQNAKHYPYFDTDWQEGAAHYAREHVYSSLTAGLSPELQARVGVAVLSITAVKPLNVLVKRQSAKGLTVHLMVRGVALGADAPDDVSDGDEAMEEPVPAQPIATRALILDGGVSSDGLTPSASVGQIQIKGAGDHRTKNGIWYAPSLVAAQRAKEAAEAADARDGAWPVAGSGKGSFWPSRRTERRAAQRETKAAQARAERFGKARDGESGNESDTSDASHVRRMAKASVSWGADGGGASGGGSSAGGGAAPDLR